MTLPMPRRPPPHHDQRKLLRSELHATIDAILDAWADVERQADEMSRGHPPSVLADSTSRGHGSTLVELQALQALRRKRGDPGQQAAEWLAHLAEFIAHARTLHDELNRLKPASEAEREALRTDTVDLCVECNRPVVGRIKRLDGQPYHHPDDQIEGGCWWKAYNRTRGRRD